MPDSGRRQRAELGSFLLPGLRLAPPSEFRAGLAHETGSERRLYVATTLHPTLCPHCSCRDLGRHDARQQAITDAPHFEQPTVLVIKRTRWRCKACGKITNDPLFGVDEKRKITERLKGIIYMKCLMKPFKEVALEVGLSDVTARNIFLEEAKRREAEARAAKVNILGLSKLSIGGTSCILLADLARDRIITLIPHTTGVELLRWLRGWPAAAQVQHLLCGPETGLDAIARMVLTQTKPVAPRSELYRLALLALRDGLAWAREVRAIKWEIGDTSSPSQQDIALADQATDILWAALSNLPLAASSAQALHEAITPDGAENGAIERQVLRFHSNFFHLWPDIADEQRLTSVMQCWDDLEPDFPATHYPVCEALEEHMVAISVVQKQPLLQRLCREATGLGTHFNKHGAGYSAEALRLKILSAHWALSETENRNSPHSYMLDKVLRRHNRKAAREASKPNDKGKKFSARQHPSQDIVKIGDIRGKISSPLNSKLKN